MTVAETSLEAYKKILRNGQEVNDRKRCLLIIKHYGPITMQTMEIHMGKHKSAFSGRVKTLKDQGKVQVTGYEDGHQVLEYVPPEERRTQQGDPLLVDQDTGEVIAE